MPTRIGELDRGHRVRRDAVFVVVGAYNEAPVIRTVVTELRARFHHVVVVDDGSTDGTGALAVAAGARVLRHVVNRGQGAALQTGLSYSLARGARYIVTFDADGQHRTEDIDRLLEPLIAGEAEIALGSRFLGRAENIPWLRWLTLKGGVLFTRGISGGGLSDTHNGLRALTRRAAERIRITEDRMAHASELIDQVIASGLAYTEVPVTIRYTEYSKAKGQPLTALVRILVDDLSRRFFGPAR